jgi:hypothetical protein
MTEGPMGGQRTVEPDYFEESDNKMIHIARRLPLISIAATIIVMAFAPAALAADSSVETYGGAGGKIQSQIQTGESNDPGTATDPGGALPFTGLDLGLVAGGGVLLLGAGALMTAAAARTRPSH